MATHPVALPPSLTKPATPTALLIPPGFVDVPDVDYTIPLPADLWAMIESESVEEEDSPDFEGDEVDEEDFALTDFAVEDEGQPDETVSQIPLSERVFEPI